MTNATLPLTVKTLASSKSTLFSDRALSEAILYSALVVVEVVKCLVSSLNRWVEEASFSCCTAGNESDMNLRYAVF